MKIPSHTRVECEGCGHRYFAPKNTTWPLVCPRCQSDAAPLIWLRANTDHRKHPINTALQMTWIVDSEGCYCVHGKECMIWLELRPPFCDRGNYIAKINAFGPLARDLDSADQWPRYYFDITRAQLEIEAWLVKRKQA